MSLECVCEISPQNTTKIIYYTMSQQYALFWVKAKTCSFHVCLFKCKWASFQNRVVPLQLLPRILCQQQTKSLFNFDYHLYYGYAYAMLQLLVTIKRLYLWSVKKPCQLKPLINGFLSVYPPTNILINICSIFFFTFFHQKAWKNV